MSEFCRRLKAIRKSRSLTQEELAEKADISRVMVSRYETDAVVPTVDVLISLANALNVSIDYLLGRVDSEQEIFCAADSAIADQAFKQAAGDAKDTMPQNTQELRAFVMSILRECIVLNP